jgi:hypothetical protein
MGWLYEDKLRFKYSIGQKVIVRPNGKKELEKKIGFKYNIGQKVVVRPSGKLGKVRRRWCMWTIKKNKRGASSHEEKCYEVVLDGSGCHSNVIESQLMRYVEAMDMKFLDSISIE